MEKFYFATLKFGKYCLAALIMFKANLRNILEIVGTEWELKKYDHVKIWTFKKNLTKV